MGLVENSIFERENTPEKKKEKKPYLPHNKNTEKGKGEKKKVWEKKDKRKRTLFHPPNVS